MPALEEMRVLDMTQYEAGTSCTQALAWQGADVVKVERPGDGDPGRSLTRDSEKSQYFLNYNSNKRSVVLDLTKSKGRELLLELAPQFDVFVENYGPGVIEKLDIGYEVMLERNPSIIYARIKGFGLSGPYADYKCYDSVALAAGGAYSINGESEGPPMRPGATYGDSGTGIQMAFAIAAAYVQQQRTGEGQLIELSMQEAVTFFMKTQGRDSWGKQAAPRLGNGITAPTNVYPCKPGGPNDYVHLCVVTSRMWDTLCVALNRPDLATDPRFETQDLRKKHRTELYQEIEKWTLQRTKYEAMHELAPAGVPCTAVLSTRDLWEDPHLRERGLIETLDHPEYGSFDLMRSPTRMSASNVELEAAPLLGQHTDEVLSSDLNLTAAELAELHASDVIS
jgi:formyl-CoA transferase